MPELKGMWIRPDLRTEIYDRDDWICQYCGRFPEYGDELTLDHVVVRGEGVDNSPTNLLTACRSCNCSRQDKPFDEWCSYLAVRVGLDPKFLEWVFKEQRNKPLPGKRKERVPEIKKMGMATYVTAYASARWKP